ncbi:hypothetical protein D3C87_1665670 [compost metagenome]
MVGADPARIPLEGMAPTARGQHQRRSRVALGSLVGLSHRARRQQEALAREVVGVGVDRAGTVEDPDPGPQDLAAGSVLDLGIEQGDAAGRLVLDEDLGEVGAVREGRIEHVADQPAVEQL